MLASDVLRRVRAWTGDEAGSFVDSDDVIDMINDAQLELNVEAKVFVGDHPFNTVIGTHTIALPADFISVRRVSFSTDGYLQPIPRNQVVSSNPPVGVSTNRGHPKYYSVEGTNLRLYPTPDLVAAGNIEYIKVPTTINVVGDTLVLPSYLHPLVARMVFSYIKERDEDYEAANSIKAETFQKASILVAKANDAQEETYPIVRDMSYDYYEF